MQTHSYNKPAALIENEENKQQFNNLSAFLEITVPVDFELFNEIFYADEFINDNEELEIREVYVQGEGKFTETLKNDQIISTTKLNQFASSLNREKFVEQLKYD